jgi:heteromeric Ino2p/Ino4p transcription factor
MSSSNNTESPTQDGANATDDKPRLTEEEKKQNHIASGSLSRGGAHSLLVTGALTFWSLHLEQKRRQAIREGFDRLTELVPGLEGQGRSEGIVLNRTVTYIRDQLAARRELIQKVESSGGTVDDALRKSVSDFL